MPESYLDLELTTRETKQESARLARQNLVQAAISGKGIDPTDLAQARGLVLRERENSIFSDAWVPLAILFLIIGLLANLNAGFIALGAVLLIIVVVSTLWKNLSLYGVSYERQFDRTRVFPGEAVELTVTIQNDKHLPLTWLRFRDKLPVPPDTFDSHFSLLGEQTGNSILQSVLSMQNRERVSRRTVLRFPTRGFYQLGPVTYESGDIFTLFTREREHKYIDTLIVYPQIWPLAELGLPPKEPFGEVRVRQSLFTDPIRTRGIRDYSPGDRFRDIHWKASARRGHLQSKVYDPSTGMTMGVFLNVATFARHWMGFDPELLERSVSVAASICNYGVQQGWGVGLFANGAVPDSDQSIKVRPGRSLDQLGNILEALAAVTEFATGSIDVMLLRESPYLPWVSTIVVVTAVITDELRIALVRLREAGRRVVLLALGDEPPPLMRTRYGSESVLTYHIPADVPAFQRNLRSASAIEAALSDIPTPTPVRLKLEEAG